MAYFKEFLFTADRKTGAGSFMTGVSKDSAAACGRQRQNRNQQDGLERYCNLFHLSLP
jgi:hypothetical protein